MVRFKKDPTGPGSVIDRRGSGGSSGGGLVKMGAGDGGIIALV